MMKKLRPFFALVFGLVLIACQPSPATPIETTTSQTVGTTENRETPTPTLTPANTETPSDLMLKATLHEVEGSVEAKDIQENVFSSATEGRTIEKDGQVRTLDDGYTRVDLSTGTLIRMAPLSYFTLVENEPQDESLLTHIKLEVGQIWIVLNGGSLEVETPSGQASVRGSYMMVQVDPQTQEAFITCLEGHCELKNPAGIIELVNGQRAKFQPPELTEGDFILPSIEGMSERDFAEWLFFTPESEAVFPLLAEESLLPWHDWEEVIPKDDELWSDFEDNFPDTPLFDGPLPPLGDGTLVDGDGTMLDGDGTIIDGGGTILDGNGTIIDGGGAMLDGDGTIIDGNGPGGGLGGGDGIRPLK